MDNNIKEAGLNQESLEAKLAEDGLKPKDVFFAMLDSRGDFVVQPRSGRGS